MKKNIGEFLPSYPEQNDKDFNSKIWAKEEFRELIPPISEKPPKKGGSYTHQKYGTRFFTQFDRNLRLDEPGTGKSCIVAHSAELFKAFSQDKESPPGKKIITINKCIILVKNKTLESNIREQIVCKCTKGLYETPKILKAMREGKGFERASRKEVNKWYEIMTYRAFAKHVSQLEDSQLEKYMTDAAIYVDEAQYIVGGKGGDQKTGEEDEEDMEEAPEPEEVYEIINKAFHMGKRNKIMLLTATPMINTADQIVPLINLLIPNRLDITMQELTDLSFEELLERLESVFRGLVTYIKRPQTDVKEEYIGLPIDNLDIPLDLVSMSDLQWKIYRQQNDKTFALKKKSISNFVFPDGRFGDSVYHDYVKIENHVPKVKSDDFKEILREPDRKLIDLSPKFVRILQICEEISNYPVERKIEKGVIFIFFPHFAKGSGAELLSLVLEYNGYDRYNTKESVFDRTDSASVTGCGEVSESVNRKITGITKRKRFVLLTGTTDKNITSSAMEILHSVENRYGEYIQVVIGTKVLREGISIDNGCAVIFSSPPWNQSAFIQARDRIFRATSHTYKLEELRKEAKERGEDPSKIVIPVKIYAMASVHQTPISIDENTKELLNYETPDLVVNITEDDKYNAILFDKPAPFVEMKADQKYSPSNSYKVERMYAVEGEPSILILSQPRLKADPEFIGDILYGYDLETQQLIENTVIETNEVRLYRLIQRKDKVITKVFDVMKTVAVDCPNNKLRNDRPDTKEQRINCWNIFDLPRDYSGKYLYYADEEVSQVVEKLRQVFVSESYLSLSRIYSLFPDISPILVSIALDTIIKHSIKYPILDNYGRKQYIKKADTGAFFVASDPFTFSITPEISYYTKSLIQECNPRVDRLRAYSIDESIVPYYKLVEGLSEEDDDYKKEWFDTLNLYDKVRIYEEAKRRVVEEGKTNAFFDYVFEQFYNDSFELPEPTQGISQISSVLLREGYTQGKKSSVYRSSRAKISAPLKRELEKLKPGEEKTTELVYIHKILPSEEEAMTAYTPDKVVGTNLRIFKPSEEIGFRSMTKQEADVYVTILEKERKSKTDKYRKVFNIFGISGDKGFRILNQLKEEKVVGKKGQKDNRGVSRGQVCGSLKIIQLHEILSYLKIDDNFDTDLYESMYKDYPIEDIKKEYTGISFKGFDDESIRRFITWEKGDNMVLIKGKNGKTREKKLNREMLCSSIYDYMKEKGMIFGEGQVLPGEETS